MTPDYIALHAQQQPDAVAVIDHGKVISRARLHREMLCVSAALRTLGVQPGSRVLLVCAHNYLHWLLRLACECLGAVSDAVLDPAHEPWPLLHERADLLLSTLPAPQGLRCRYQAITQAWLDALFAVGELPAIAWPSMPGDAPALVARTSGTTGQPRRMRLSYNALAHRIEAWCHLFELEQQSRCLLTLQTTAATALYQAAACMRMGAIVVFAAPGDVMQTVSRQGITHIACLPGALAHWLTQMPSDFQRPPQLHLVCMGAYTSAALRELALRRLVTRFDDVYACNEAGHIAAGLSANADGIGVVRPGIEVEIVGPEGTPEPFGCIGQIRLRSPSLAAGYLDDADATALHFKNGWYDSGDLGTMIGPGHLTVLGRTHDLLNLGGIKVAPHIIEARLVGPDVPAHELAICSLPNGFGIDEVWVAVCGTAAENRSAVIDALTRISPQYWWVTFRVIRLPQVHPLPPAKLSRATLRTAVQQQLLANKAAD